MFTFRLLCVLRRHVRHINPKERNSLCPFIGQVAWPNRKVAFEVEVKPKTELKGGTTILLGHFVFE